MKPICVCLLIVMAGLGGLARAQEPGETQHAGRVRYEMGGLARAQAPGDAASAYFRIMAIDGATSRGVPLVKLTTLNGIAHWTDSAGMIAFHEPGLMGRELWFNVESHGYEVPADGFGYRGVRLTPEPGGRATVTLNRTMIAQRLYRLTGTGIYRDSVLLGDRLPIREPMINTGVLGQDSTLTTIYRGRKFWIWGDTTRASYPLAANFKVTGATSALPGAGGLDPESGVDFEYFAEGDFTKKLAPFESPGPVWLSSLLTVPDASGEERLLAMFHLIAPPMDTKGRGRAQWNDAKQEFEIIARYDMDDVMQPDGHPLRVWENGEKSRSGDRRSRDDEQSRSGDRRSRGGVEHFYFPSDSRFHRTRADYQSVLDLAAYEAWTCLAEGAHFDPKAPEKSQLSPDGWGWRRATSAIGQREQDELETAGLLRPEQRWFRLIDPETGARVAYHGGSIYWNEYRRRWVMIFGELFGTSVLGEIWYAEADAPLGPWGYAAKVVTHTKYSFYNPVQHPDFAKDGGRVIFFEGTYTTSFSGAETPTPRYDYNQIMYQLELDDARLVLPQPVYFVAEEWPHYRFGPEVRSSGNLFPRSGESSHGPADETTAEQVLPAASKYPVVFYALDRPRKGAVPVYERRTGEGASILTANLAATQAPRDAAASLRTAFYALPAGAKPTTTTAALMPVTMRMDGKTLRLFTIPGDPILQSSLRLQATDIPPGRDGAVCTVWRPPVAYNPFTP